MSLVSGKGVVRDPDFLRKLTDRQSLFGPQFPKPLSYHFHRHDSTHFLRAMHYVLDIESTLRYDYVTHTIYTEAL